MIALIPASLSRQQIYATSAVSSLLRVCWQFSCRSLQYVFPRCKEWT